MLIFNNPDHKTRGTTFHSCSDASNTTLETLLRYGWSTYELFWVHRYHPELNWNDLNCDDASLAIYTSHFKLEAVEHPKILFYMAKSTKGISSQITAVIPLCTLVGMGTTALVTAAVLRLKSTFSRTKMSAWCTASCYGKPQTMQGVAIEWPTV